MSNVGFQPFAHLTVPNAEQYRRIMAAFALAKRRLAVHLRPEDLQEAAGAESPAVADALQRLVDWGNCARSRTPAGLRRSRTSIVLASCIR